jgi:GT2 family glycosyltransferase
VEAGPHLIALDIPDPSTLVRIRFDPGDIPGNYVLDRFSVIVPQKTWRKIPEIQNLRQSKTATQVKKDVFEAWLDVNRFNSRGYEQLSRRLCANRDRLPTISVVVPVYNTPVQFLQSMIDSVTRQIYDNWELCIADDCSKDLSVKKYLKNAAERDTRIKLCFSDANGGISEATNTAASLATGEFLAFLDHDDELTVDALAEVAVYLAEHPDTDYLYTDDDKIDIQGRRYDPQFKPHWSPEFLLSCMYCCHLVVIRRALFESLGGMRSECDGAQDYDLALRATEQARQVAHVPLILYHWRAAPESTSLRPSAKSYTTTAARKAIEDALVRRNINAKVEIPKWAASAGVWRFSLVFADRGPSVSILIPTKFKVDVLHRCLESLKKTSYENYQVVVIDNESDTPEMLEYLKSLDLRVLRIGNSGPTFNFSHINNVAAEFVDSDYILFLNDDTEVLRPGWLSTMVGYARIDGVGAVGARLLYPDGSIQHAGIVNGLKGGLPDHEFKLQRWEERGHLDSAMVARNCSGVTAACLLTRRALFLELGGFDEKNFPRAFQDPDYCLRLIDQGSRVVYCPDAELIHYESTSRAKDYDSEEHVRYAQKYCMYKDPYYSPYFSLDPPPHMKIRPRRMVRGPTLVIRTLVVLPSACPPDASILIYLLVSELHRLGVLQPHILSHSQDRVLDEYEKNGFAVTRIPSASLMSPLEEEWQQQAKASKELLEENEIELVWAFGIQNCQHIAVAHEIGTPAIWTLDESATDFRSSHSYEILNVVVKNLGVPYRVVFNSFKTRETLRDLESTHNFDVIPLNHPRLTDCEMYAWNENLGRSGAESDGRYLDTIDRAVHYYAEILGEAYFSKGNEHLDDHATPCCTDEITWDTSTVAADKVGRQQCVKEMSVPGKGTSFHRETHAPRIKIYHHFFRDDQVAELDPSFVPHDGRDNPFPEYYETYWFLRLWNRGWYKSADYTGFVSAKFGAKTRMDGGKFINFIKTNPGHDVYFINPFPHETYLFFNVWDQAEAAHPGIRQLAQELFDRVYPSIKICDLGRNGIISALYCNYWVGNKKFWKLFIDFVTPLFECIVDGMNEEDRSRYFQLVPHSEEIPAFPFIFERLFSTLLLTHPDIKACPYKLSQEEIRRIYTESVDFKYWEEIRSMVGIVDEWDKTRDKTLSPSSQRSSFRTLWDNR